MKKSRSKTFKVIGFIASMLMLGNAQAHSIWLEQDALGATLYFGEFGGNLREASPGLLDKFGKPTAQKVSRKGAEDLTASKTANGFAVVVNLAKGESLIAQDAAYPITERRDGDKTIRSLYAPAARLVTDYSQQAPQLTLDLVPTGKQDGASMEVQAFYKGKPIPKVKIEVVAASGWTQEMRADEQGKVTINMPWTGSYVLEVKQADTAGERGIEKYDRASYVTNLTVMQAEGLAALPPAKAATPNVMK